MRGVGGGRAEGPSVGDGRPPDGSGSGGGPSGAGGWPDVACDIGVDAGSWLLGCSIVLAKLVTLLSLDALALIVSVNYHSAYNLDNLAEKLAFKFDEKTDTLNNMLQTGNCYTQQLTTNTITFPSPASSAATDTSTVSSLSLRSRP